MKELELQEFTKNRILYLIDNAHMTFRSLSLEIGKSDSYIQKLISGEVAPSIYVINDICNVFHIELSDFFNPNLKCPIEYQRVNELLISENADRLKALFTLLEK